jgi:hypothetical protein
MTRYRRPARPPPSPLADPCSRPRKWTTSGRPRVPRSRRRDHRLRNPDGTSRTGAAGTDAASRKSVACPAHHAWNVAWQMRVTLEPAEHQYLAQRLAAYLWRAQSFKQPAHPSLARKSQRPAHCRAHNLPCSKRRSATGSPLWMTCHRGFVRRKSPVPRQTQRKTRKPAARTPSNEAGVMSNDERQG